MLKLILLIMLTSACNTDKQTFNQDETKKTLFGFSKCNFACKGIPLNNDILHVEEIGNISNYQGNELDIVIWNLHKQKDTNWTQTFRNLDADVYLLQEILLTDKFRDAVDNKLLTMSTSFFMKNDNRTGTGVLSNAYPINSKSFISKQLEFLARTPKSITVTEFQNIDIISVHAMTSKNIMKQIKKLDRQLSGDHPLIIAGDFNTNRVKELRKLDKFMTSHNLTRVTDTLSINGKRSLDHIYIRNVEITKHVEVIETESSDHPIMKISIKI